MDKNVVHHEPKIFCSKNNNLQKVNNSLKIFINYDEFEFIVLIFDCSILLSATIIHLHPKKIGL